MSFDPEGKVVLITGSSRGIGRETAMLFAERGARIVLNGRDPARLAETLERMQRFGENVWSYPADVTDAGQCQAMIEAVLARFGRLDVLVNNAGLSMRGAFADLDPSVIEAVTRVNIVGSALPTRFALTALRETHGSVVFVSSLAGVRGFAGVSIYSAAKMALTGLAESIHAENVSEGVHAGVLFLAFTENDPDKTIMGPDGAPIRITRTASTTQRQAAEAVYRMVRRRSRKTYLTASGKYLVFMQRHFPRLTDAVILRSKGSIHRARRKDEPN